MIQQGTKFHMPVAIDGAALEELESVELLFKQDSRETAPAKKKALWKADGTGDAVTGQDAQGNPVLLIPWTREETYLFAAGTKFYLHARVHYAASDDEPPVPIAPLTMAPTLFAEGEEVTAP